MKSMSEQFKAARKAGTPLMAIKTPDPEATMQSLQKLNGKVPIVVWDVIRGLTARNKAGDDAINEALDGGEPGDLVNVVDCTVAAQKLPKGTLLFLLNAHRFLDPASSVFKPDFLQAFWILRDTFKANLRSAVLLAPDLSLPSELQHDVFVLDEPLPKEDSLLEIVTTQIGAFNTSRATASKSQIEVDEETRSKAVDALRGLAAFPSEQAVAMCLSENGVDLEGLWERKRRMISDTKALSVFTGKRSFAGIGGCEQIKKFLQGVINGLDAPQVIVFIDEGEKAFAGASEESSGDNGVSKDAMGQILTYMEDEESDGAIFLGPAGCAKSELAKTLGSEAGIPTIVLDMGGAKGSLMGESEQGIRNALKVITAVGRAYFVMTCNKVNALPAPLKRRFTSGIWYFDLPTSEERPLIWDIQQARFQTTGERGEVKDKDWTGAEIRNCCRLSYRQRITLQEASQYIAPVAKTDAKGIESLRREASGRYLSASYPGLFDMKFESKAASARSFDEE